MDDVTKVVNEAVSKVGGKTRARFCMATEVKLSEKP
jgi:hypothetical protein